MATKILTPRQQSYRNSTKKSHRYQDSKVPRVIQFIGRTLEYIYRALERLKSRYKKIVRLMEQKSTGASLYNGKIAIL